MLTIQLPSALNYQFLNIPGNERIVITKGENRIKNLGVPDN